MIKQTTTVLRFAQSIIWPNLTFFSAVPNFEYSSELAATKKLSIVKLTTVHYYMHGYAHCHMQLDSLESIIFCCTSAHMQLWQAKRRECEQPADKVICVTLTYFGSNAIA